MIGLEAWDGSGVPMADDPVEALFGRCEKLDLNEQETGADAEAAADSNGNVTEEVGARIGVDDAAPIEPVPEAAGVDEAAGAPQGSRPQAQAKNWSDFSAVSARTLGEQSFGSFSDFLAIQRGFPPDGPLQSSGAVEKGLNVDFFEWGSTGSEPLVAGGMGVMATQFEPPAAAVVEKALPDIYERSPDTGTSLAGAEVAPPQASAENDTGIAQQVQTWSGLLVHGGQTVAALTDTEAAQSSDPYPGWHYDHQAGEWRQVEGYGTIAAGSEDAGYTGRCVELHDLQAIPEANAFQPDEGQTSVEQDGGVAGEVGLGQSQSWDTQSAATQTVPDEYPGWKWDYAAQTWVAVPDFIKSWESSSDTQSQDYSGQQSWHGQQEQQAQSYGNESNDLSYGEKPVACNEQQQQPQGLSGYACDGANVMDDGYTSGGVNSVSTESSAHPRKTKQWQWDLTHNNAAAGEASFFYAPQVNGERNWGVPALNKQEQFASQSLASDSYSSPYSYTATCGHNAYTQQAQQPWGYASHLKQYQQFTNPTAAPPKSVQEAIRTCVGRPPVSLAAFGFGGRFIFMKHRDHTSNGDQAFASGEAWMPGPIQVSRLKTHLSEESTFAGPFLGGGGSPKELMRWIDERMSAQSPYDSSRLLLGVLKVACQHYGKLRSSGVNAGNSAMEDGGPEAALAKLLAGAGGEQSPYAGMVERHPGLRGVPSEQQLQATASEVEKSLVCGKRKDALRCAQEGELWGIALVIARQLGEKLFCDTVTEMARRQFVAGSPLRTLSLLLAGQPAEVFAAPRAQTGSPMGGTAAASDESQDEEGAMLDEWRENIAMMAANRTQGDERVMLHLGDRLWGVRGEVAAAHLCYLVADANLASYSGNARLCLIGGDHCKNPRTFVTAEAIQRTEIYEHAKVLGKPQSVVISFQPYKLVYAEMLVECGKAGDSLKYCQTVLKTLKSAGIRSPEVEAWKALATQMEERLRVHLQDGHGSKLVERIKGTMDWGILKLIGGPPPSGPAAGDSFGYRALDKGDDYGGQSSRPNSSGGQRSGAEIAPSVCIAGSMERVPQEPNRGPGRSQSESELGRNAKQGETEGQSGVSSRAGGLSLGGLGRLGSTFLQRARGLWSSNSKEAKLGDANKFYYDENLKKWVEEGVDPAPESAPLPPPPTASRFTGTSPFQEEAHGSSQAVTSKPGTPPLAPIGGNHYSNRRQGGGVRSRYVDTFNKGGSTGPVKSVTGSLMPPPMAGAGMTSTVANMFVPGAAPGSPFQENNGDAGESFVGGCSKNGDVGGYGGLLSDSASSNTNMGAGVGYPPPTYCMNPQVWSADNGRASLKAESADLSSDGAARMFGGAHTRSSSWGGYPSSFQDAHVPGEEDVFGASCSGRHRVSRSEQTVDAASLSVGQSGYSNFSLPKGSGGDVPVPPPPPLGVPSTGGENRDLSRHMTGQQFGESQSVGSVTGEETQEVEL
ncbi:protein transport protein SEC16A homolog [Physcomitrium patens]|uniref:Protein transport protein sec16 n=1 Tax=Physcomitrium patens TaxID=3218 RepID=A0A7I4ADU3_PHYPA|nr:protein transport protein SEC16A homolog isoform X1 [Physcomitrium patens]XP_024391505.1 protein transport protein SEC16A homolog isoform X1 [Physcomitrium patens]XP_024391506.1 protein transport protein SEC16A homolog isoform X1 [Physcomitrium patens]XP_024391507.1 protein transport protein SEC16A homolog isoform X1 [Physcomitrium patens]XP_024391508.1 protein transport protein SEC16A homolog isoform X1 [Physcomitrium patens]XP_024391509.1 protein transport protein SEC16A homolog isoform X|eukprot:XP_024391503.1 protein transport protein SEC16A homolog isoform X1 [Physcomitrella patens]